jgi:L-iditol 2-dehydrogenase
LTGRELSIIGTFGHKWSNWDLALRMMKNGQIRVNKMITHVFPLSEWEKGFNVAENQEGIKVLLCP